MARSRCTQTPTAQQRGRRAKYIQDLQKAAPILGTEYAYIEGSVLVRGVRKAHTRTSKRVQERARRLVATASVSAAQLREDRQLSVKVSDNRPVRPRIWMDVGGRETHRELQERAGERSAYVASTEAVMHDATVRR